MKLEYYVIGVMIFLVGGVLALIATSPDVAPIPKVEMQEINHGTISVAKPESESEEQKQERITLEESISLKELTSEEPLIEPEGESSETEASKTELLPQSAEVIIPEGSGVPGCEEISECYTPNEVTIASGGTVTWNNEDTASHTVTSGNLRVNPDTIGVDFDSGLFTAGSVFSYTFDKLGNYDYFCMVHPWMEGTIIVS